MEILTHLKRYPIEQSRPLILALGNFDGLHLGHQQILRNVVDHAKKINGVPAVLTFFEHPQRILHPSKEPPLLTSLQHRLFLFQEMGIQICFLLHFTVPFSKTSPEKFVEDCLKRSLGVSEVHLGYNGHFGFDRRGDSSLMKNLSKRLGFKFCETEPVKVGGQFVSSTLIREAVREGDLTQARRFLGRPFSIFASVVRGKGRGRRLGYPTANLRPRSEILPPRGVYPVEIREKLYHLKPTSETFEFEFVLENSGEWRHGVLNYGVRPTLEGATADPIPEVFILNYSGDLYGKTVEVVFHPRLREEKRFVDSNELVQAITEDVNHTQHYFHSVSKSS
jgi:riboflavin kinase/FMN adenylyltransferase